jgi:hypothetical protein
VRRDTAVDVANRRASSLAPVLAHRAAPKNPVVEEIMRDAMEALGERIAEQAVHLDAALHRLLTDLRAFDVGGGWQGAGARSCAAWLSWRLGMGAGVAREHVRVARRLGELPKIDEALRRGELSYSKVRALTRAATPETEELFLHHARYMTGAQLETLVKKRVAVGRLGGADPTEVHRRRRVWRRQLDDGMVMIQAVLRPEEAAIVWASITAAAAATFAETLDRAAGLVAVAESYARGDAPDRAPVEIVVTTSADLTEAGETGDGAWVPAETCRRLACDAAVVAITESPTGEILSVGRRTRTIPAAIRRALRRRDPTCRFPGCACRVFLDGHHVDPWADGGETRLDRLLHLCRHHHTLVHEGGFRVELDLAQQPTFYDPRGRRIEAIAPRPRPPDLGWPAIEAGNADLALDAATNRPRWDGRPPDYGACVEGLLGVDASAMP